MARQASQPWLRTQPNTYVKVWYYTTADGKQRSLGFKEADKEQAYKKWHGIMATAGIIPKEEQTSLQTLVLTFLALLMPRVSEYYYKQMKATLNDLILAFSEKPIGEIRSCHLEDWIDAHNTWNDSTKCANKRHITTFFKWLKTREVLDKTPTTDIRAYRPKARGMEVIIKLDDWAMFIEQCKGSFKALCSLLWLTGARPSELRCLQIEEVDLVNKVIAKKEHKLKHKGKSRRILLSDQACAILRSIIQDRKTGFVSMSRNKSRWTKAGFNDRWRTARRKAGLPPTMIPYGVRHTFTVTMLRNGVPAHAVASMLGHSGTATLYRHYGHILDDIESYRKWL